MIFKQNYIETRRMPINCLFYGLFCVALSGLGALRLLIRYGLPGKPSATEFT